MLETFHDINNEPFVGTAFMNFSRAYEDYSFCSYTYSILIGLFHLL